MTMPEPANRLKNIFTTGADRIWPAITAMLLTLLCLSGCIFLNDSGQLKTPPQKQTATPPANKTIPTGPFEQADAAWTAKDYQTSENMYQKLLASSSLDATQRSLSWERLSQSYLFNQHYKEALLACNRWLLEQPSAQSKTNWQNCWIAALTGLGRSSANEELLNSTIAGSSKPLRLKAQAAFLLASWHPQDINLMASALENFENLHRDSKNSRPDTEALLLKGMQTLSDQTLEQTASLAQAEQSDSLAYAAVKFEQARRTLNGENREYALQILNALRTSSALTDKSAIDKLLNPGMVEGAPPFTPGAPMEVGLLLPTSGPYANMGWKVMRGAETAQAEFEKYGQRISIRHINTDDPNWVQSFRALPPTIKLVGGPIQPSALKTLQTADGFGDKIIFTFMADLGEIPEGRGVWRFFFSQADQARALLDFAVNECELRSLGILAPDENYGHKMAQVFRQQAASYGLDIAPAASAIYPPQQPQEWGKVISSMLGVSGAKDVPPPNTAFQAIFLPDSWSQAEMLIPQFYYYQEERLLFMGSALWTQSFVEGPSLAGQNPDFIISPSMWWPDNPASAAVALKTALISSGAERPDMWVALGYDFVRFAGLLSGHLNTYRELLSEEVNNALLSASSSMPWSIAPISWDPFGRASQRLFIVAPTRSGPRLADPTKMRSNLAKAREAHELRRKIFYGEEIPEKQEWIDNQPED